MAAHWRCPQCNTGYSGSLAAKSVQVHFSKLSSLDMAQLQDVTRSPSPHISEAAAQAVEVSLGIKLMVACFAAAPHPRADAIQPPAVGRALQSSVELHSRSCVLGGTSCTRSLVTRTPPPQSHRLLQPTHGARSIRCAGMAIAGSVNSRRTPPPSGSS